MKPRWPPRLLIRKGDLHTFFEHVEVQLYTKLTETIQPLEAQISEVQSTQQIAQTADTALEGSTANQKDIQ